MSFKYHSHQYSWMSLTEPALGPVPADPRSWYPFSPRVVLNGCGVDWVSYLCRLFTDVWVAQVIHKIYTSPHRPNSGTMEEFTNSKSINTLLSTFNAVKIEKCREFPTAITLLSIPITLSILQGLSTITIAVSITTIDFSFKLGLKTIYCTAKRNKTAPRNHT